MNNITLNGDGFRIMRLHGWLLNHVPSMGGQDTAVYRSPSYPGHEIEINSRGEWRHTSGKGGIKLHGIGKLTKELNTHLVKFPCEIGVIE
jgi:hypothetical protein